VNIKTKLLLPPLIGFLIFIAYMQFVWVPLELENAREEFKVRNTEILKSISTDIMRSMMENDFAVLFSELDQQLEIHGETWHKLFLYDDAGKKIYPLFSTKESEIDQKNIFLINYPIKTSDISLGHIELWVDWTRAKDKAVYLQNQLVLMLIGIMGLFFLVSLISIQKILYLPLKQLEKAANKLSRGSFQVELPAPRNDELGELTRAFDTMRTELEASLKRIQSDEERQRVIIETIGDGLLIVDARGVILSANNAVTRILGYSTDELKGQSLEMILPNNIRKQHFGLMQKMLISQDLHSKVIGNTRPLRAQCKDGKEVDISLNVGEFEINGEKQYSTVFRDVTEENKVNKELVKARAEAEKANQAKSEFLANMSHEIRTPMNAILGMSYLALTSNLDAHNRNYIEKVYRSAESLLRIINDILDYSKIEAKHLELESVNFQIEEVLDNIVNLLALKAEEKNIELLFHFQNEIPRALIGDPLRLEQILINLGSNAIKFTDAGGDILIDIKCLKKSKQEVSLQFSVIDTGIGMTSEQVKTLFKPFVQADTSITRKYGGTGLGLSISQHLVELMDGKIWIESTPGQGSAFHFIVKLQCQEEHDSPAEPEDISLSFSDKPLAETRALVVDDNANARDIMSEMLRTLSIQVSCVSSGIEAIKTFMNSVKEKPFDLIFMDWHMPELDGVETIRKIQELTDKENAPAIIMVTALARNDALNAAEDIHLKALLTKPVTPSSLLDCLMHYDKKKNLPPTFNKESDIARLAQNIHGAHLLLVEDNSFNQELVCDLLSSHGIYVEVASNGQEALDMLSSQSYDGILMDCQMPVMDGYTATQHIRKMEGMAELPIIAMTANVMSGDREKVIDAGMNDHIGKPINVKDLFYTLSQWIKPVNKNLSSDNTDYTTPTDSVASTDNKQAPQLPHFSFIDPSIGLNLLDNDEVLYREVLMTFVNYHGNTEQELHSALAQNDMEVARRIIHTIKGIAGNIGAFKLQKASEELEQVIKKTDNNIPDSEPSLIHFFDQLRSVLNELELLSATESEKNNNSFTDQEVAEKLEEIRTLLQNSDTEVEGRVAELCSGINNKAVEKHLKNIASCLERYDFEQALKELDKISFS